MLRQTLARSAWRTGRQAANASRALSTTPKRNAEVELTIGKNPSTQAIPLIPQRRLTRL